MNVNDQLYSFTFKYPGAAYVTFPQIESSVRRAQAKNRPNIPENWQHWCKCFKLLQQTVTQQSAGEQFRMETRLHYFL